MHGLDSWTHMLPRMALAFQTSGGYTGTIFGDRSWSIHIEQINQFGIRSFSPSKDCITIFNVECIQSWEFSQVDCLLLKPFLADLFHTKANCWTNTYTKNESKWHNGGTAGGKYYGWTSFKILRPDPSKWAPDLCPEVVTGLQHHCVFWCCNPATHPDVVACVRSWVLGGAGA